MSSGTEIGVCRVDYYGQVRRGVFSLIPDAPHVGVLDVGGGRGGTAATLKREFGAKNVGVVDLFGEPGERDKDLDFAVKGDLNDPSVIQDVGRQHGPFSVILCLDVLEHLADPWSAVVSLEKHLRPDGVMIASIPNVAHLSVSLRLFLFGQWRLHDGGIMDRTHLRFFTKQTAIELLECGSLEVDMCDYSILPSPVMKRLNMLRFVLGPRYFAFQYFLRARRKPASS